MRLARSHPRRTRLLATAVIAAFAIPLLFTSAAGAHGSVIDPATRNYGCCP